MLRGNSPSWLTERRNSGRGGEGGGIRDGKVCGGGGREGNKIVK